MRCMFVEKARTKPVAFIPLATPRRIAIISQSFVQLILPRRAFLRQESKDLALTFPYHGKLLRWVRRKKKITHVERGKHGPPEAG
ncbi:hypothetical protein VN12_25315 [Pirellula sp. SH-Sr6A]|nr:hypothetical protein VN12_25315 [Pirellula sp. SH-Sr6A]